MVNNRQDNLGKVFSALSDPTRRAILARLSQGEASVGELARPFGMSLPAVSKHVRVLERAGLLERRREGRIHHCRLEAGPLLAAGAWLAHYRGFWEERLDALEGFLSDHPPKEE